MASSSPLTIDPKNPEKLESLGNFVSSSCGKITPNFYQLAAQRKLLSSYSTKKQTQSRFQAIFRYQVWHSISGKPLTTDPK
jgi:hypothetical protein